MKLSYQDEQILKIDGENERIWPIRPIKEYMIWPIYLRDKEKSKQKFVLRFSVW